jgi:hypothetical protein
MVGFVNNGLERIWKEAASVQIDTEENREDTQQELAGIPTENRYEPLPNTRIECFRYTDLFGKILCYILLCVH